MTAVMERVTCVWETSSDEDTEELAALLARGLRAPLVVLLQGDLGAGKTTFVRGFVRALKGGEDVVVQSPTFALARSYQTTPLVRHLDLYRLQGADSAALDELGLTEMLDQPDGFAFVEWPVDRIETAAGRLEFTILDEQRRRIHVDIPRASCSQALVERLRCEG